MPGVILGGLGGGGGWRIGHGYRYAVFHMLWVWHFPGCCDDIGVLLVNARGAFIVQKFVLNSSSVLFNACC